MERVAPSEGCLRAMVQRWTGGQQLQNDREILRLLEVDVAKLSAGEIKIAAELLRRITELGTAQRRETAMAGWVKFREVKQV